MKELIAKIRKIIEALKNNTNNILDNGDALSRARLKLSAYVASLSQYVEDTRSSRDAMEGSAKVSESKSIVKHRNDGKTGVESTAMARIEASGLWAKRNGIDHDYRVLAALRDNAKDVENAIAGRLKYLESGRANSR